MLPLSASPSASRSSLDSMINSKRSTLLPGKDVAPVIRSAKELLHDLVKNVEPAELRHAVRSEIRRLINDHDRLVSMLQQRSEHLENENQQLRHAASEHQRRYDKAVREMQFFRRRYELAKQGGDADKQQQQQCGWACSTGFEATTTGPLAKQPAYPLTPTDPHPPTVPLLYESDTLSPLYDLAPKRVSPINLNPKFGTDSVRRKAGPVMMTSTPHVHPVPMTPVRSSTSTNGYTGGALIQQRRLDPLIFGGSDGLWETLAKHKGSDITVEKTITNFLRRGGSPNTARQSTASVGAVKYGYGMIHALIVIKASTPLDLLLQQGANPNVMTLSLIEDDKVTPCFLAAQVGWLAGLQKVVQAGGDLVAARGAGVKNKTALHVAAEHCHAAVVEYIVSVTEGALNLEKDSNGATVLHYACASGHTDLVSFLARTCQIPVDQPDNRGELPLHWAARHGRLEVVTLLIERCGCDVNTYVPHKVGTPLDLAKTAGHRRLVDYLKSLGALTAKKMDRKRDEGPHKAGLENRLRKNGFGMLFANESGDENLF